MKILKKVMKAGAFGLTGLLLLWCAGNTADFFAAACIICISAEAIVMLHCLKKAASRDQAR